MESEKLDFQLLAFIFCTQKIHFCAMSDVVVPDTPARFRFAIKYAAGHLGISLTMALAAAAMVFGLLYPAPYRDMLGVGPIFLLILLVDAVCGPLLTLIIAAPRKSVRERWIDFSFIGLIQLTALVYGLHSVWVGRPVVLAFEVDRLVAVTDNEIDKSELEKFQKEIERLPMLGVGKMGVRQAKNSDEMFDAINKDAAGMSPAMRPSWWTPWSQQLDQMNARAKPLTELIARRPQDAETLRKAAQDSGVDVANLRYLPLTSSKTKDWVALLDAKLNMVGWAPVDGF